MRFPPQRASHHSRTNPGPLPTCPFIAVTVYFAVVPSTKWYNILVARLAPQSPALGKAQVVRIRGLTTANQTRLLGHMSDVIAIPHPARFRQSQPTLIDNFRSRLVLQLHRRGTLRSCRLSNIPSPSDANLCRALHSSPNLLGGSLDRTEPDAPLAMP